MHNSEELVKQELENKDWKVFRNGWPDFLCIRNGRIVAVEVKRWVRERRPYGDNRGAIHWHMENVPKEQQLVHGILRDAKIDVHVVHVKGDGSLELPPDMA